MTKFIKLHRRKPEYRTIPIGKSYKSFQIDWYDDEGPEFFFNTNKIITFSNFKVNDIDVCETADEILQELNK